MNKILSYSILACAAIASIASCKKEEENIFDKSAAERLNEASELFSERLCDSEYGWSFEYYPNSSTSIDDYVKGVGYLMMVKFNNDHSVLVGMNNTFTDKKYAADSSAWQVITDMGAVLSFNTYNKILHTFSVPENYEGAASDATGKGMLGDYEFVIVDAQENAEHIMLKGKKRKTYCRLTRLEQGVDFQSYLASIQKLQSNILSNNAPNHLVMTVGEKQYYFVMPKKGGELGLTKIWPAGSDSTFTMKLNPLLMTRHVEAADTSFIIRFRDAIDAGEGKSVQEFVYRPSTQSFVGLEDETYSIVGEDAGNFFEYGWNLIARFSFNKSAGSSKAQELLADLTQAYKNIKYTFQGVEIQKDEKNEGKAILAVKYKSGSSSGRVSFNYNATVSNGKLNLSYDSAANSAAEKQKSNLTALSTFLDALNGEFTIIPGDNPLNLSTISFQNGDLTFHTNYIK